MRVLVISTLFPPNVVGGAEISAWNLARWLREQGHEVGVLTTANLPAEAEEDVLDNCGLRIWRVWMPRRYAAARHFDRPKQQKILWHLQDHLDPRNRKIVDRVLDAFDPDFVNIHLLAGIGFNILASLADRDLPVMYALHDLAVICLRSSMFKDGHECLTRCVTCIGSSAWKQRMIAKVRRLGFYSPSSANLETIRAHFPMHRYQTLVAPNPNRYPQPTVLPAASEKVRFLYVGRLHPIKGVDTLLAAADSLADRYTFSLTIVGDGPSAAPLASAYGDRPWLRFVGRVPPEEVSNWMASSDVLCIPSIWAENSPGVVINALSCRLAILGSSKGGIPELVHHEDNGLLIQAGDVPAWAAAMERMICNPLDLEAMRENAMQRASAFDPATLGERLYDFMRAIAGGPDTDGFTSPSTAVTGR
jgi:glycosyltransferase involved in cell wall biosynthesis